MQSEIQEIKTATITEKGQICIPNAARRMAGFRKGSKISIVVYKNKVELLPLKKITEAMLPALMTEEVLAEAWNTPEEDEAWKDL